MAQPPPRPAAPRPGGSPHAPASSGSHSGLRTTKEAEKQVGTFFLGRYRVVDEIGVGGMASVHLARMDGPGGFQKWVAIKRIHAHLVEDDQFVDMFLDEARIAAGINHANVAQVFDLGKDEGTYWIAMEYLHGEPLREIMRRAEERRQPMAPALAARICADAAEGLHAAHELRGKNGQLLGLVHRDVTPHNLFITYDGYTKVVDFGIAKVADRLSSTRAGTLKGKLAYMSPEQVRGSPEIDRCTDIFALGVVLWELTTNQRLFRMDTDIDTLEKVQACVVPPPSTVIPGYPIELESVLMKALAKRKEDRFQTAREFSRALQGFLMRQGAFVGPEEVSQFVRQTFGDRIQKREAHLAWAAEVTSTINVDNLRASQGGRHVDDGPTVEEGDRSRSAAPSRMPASGARPVAGAPAAQPPAPVPAPTWGAPPAGPPQNPGAMRATPPPAPGAADPRRMTASAFSATPPPASAPAPLAAASLMDDDEDVPTTVAKREHMDLIGGHSPSSAPHAPAAYPPAGGQRPGYSTAPMPAFGGAPQPNRAPTHPTFGSGSPMSGDQTAALPAGEDLGSTVALPMNGPMDMSRQPPPQAGNRPGFGPYPHAGAPQGGHAPGMMGPGQPAAPRPGDPNNASYGSYPKPTFGQPPPSPPTFTPTVGSGLPGLPGVHLPPNGPQSQIETALSLPRPDPAALWLAQQEKQRGERRNAGVIAAVVAVTALCVFGLGALIYFKFRSSDAPPPASSATPQGTAVTTAGATAAPATTAAPTAEPKAAATGAANEGASAPTTPASTVKDKVVVAAAPAPTAAPAKEKAAGPEELGFLTIICNPYCDDVLDQGQSLGPAPIVRRPVKPGQHRVTLKKDDQSKTISVIVEPGQVAAQRVSMK